MEIRDILKKQLMIFELKSKSKEAVIAEMVNRLGQAGILTNEEAFLKAVLERERQSTTGIGMGIAIPHGKSASVKEAAVVFGKAVKAIPFEALDGQDSDLFFLIAVPEEASNQHLKILSQLSRKLMNEEVREVLRKSQSSEEVLCAFDNK